MADTALFSAHPWRAEYLKSIANRAQEFSSAGKDSVAKMLIYRLKNTSEKWKLNEIPPQDEISEETCSTVDSDINKTVADYLRAQKKHYSATHKNNTWFSKLCNADIADPDAKTNEPGEIWDRYMRWSMQETEAWDCLCSDSISRIRFTQLLDFSDYLSETWGPYNTKFNIIEALKRLKNFDQPWLESYLILYESLQKIE